MSVYASTEQATDVFGQLFAILLKDAGFVTSLRDNALSVRVIHTKPDCQLYIAPDELLFGAAVPEQAVITIKMSCDTAHALWLGRLMMPTAVATGKVRIRGKVAKVIQLVPILQPAFDRYAEIAAANGISV